MKPEDKLKERIGTDPGFRVPDGYFEEVFVKIQQQLPEREPVRVAPVGRWQRLKPYVYLAAMFAGIWCTMKMVTMMQQGAVPEQVSLDSPPAMIAQAMSSPEVAKPLVGTPSMIIIDDAADNTAEAEVASVDENVDNSTVEQEIIRDFNAAVDVENIDLAQLQQALDADNGDELYYL